MAMNGLLGVVTPNGRSPLLYNSDLEAGRGIAPGGETEPAILRSPCNRCGQGHQGSGLPAVDSRGPAVAPFPPAQHWRRHPAWPRVAQLLTANFPQRRRRSLAPRLPGCGSRFPDRRGGSHPLLCGAAQSVGVSKGPTAKAWNVGCGIALARPSRASACVQSTPSTGSVSASRAGPRRQRQLGKELMERVVVGLVRLECCVGAAESRRGCDFERVSSS